jgi:hypothetical protein
VRTMGALRRLLSNPSRVLVLGALIEKNGGRAGHV